VKGKVHQTARLAIGASIETWPKYTIIIGIVNEKARRVKTKLSLIASIFGRKENNLSKKSLV
jgi:hypothetical protein